jgi:hypothetical protein
MTEFKFRYNGDHTDFDQWEFDDDDDLFDLEKKLSEILARRMATIFSENGATVDIDTPLTDGNFGDLIIEVDVNVDQCDSLAGISVPLSELIINYATYAGTTWRKSASLALRNIAETIDTLIGCPSDDFEIWTAPRRRSGKPDKT